MVDILETTEEKPADPVEETQPKNPTRSKANTSVNDAYEAAACVVEQNSSRGDIARKIRELKDQG